MGLAYPNLSSAQRRTQRFRIITTIGAACGVAIGCIIGMINFLFIDFNRAERLKRQKELDTIFETIMETGPALFQSERITLWLYDNGAKVFFTKAISGQDELIEVPHDKGLVGYVWRSAKMINLDDAYLSPHFDQSNDDATGYRTKQVLAAPVWSSPSSDSQVVGVIMVINKAGGKSFTKNDEKMMRMLQSHVRIFMDVFEHDAEETTKSEPVKITPVV